MAKELKKTDLVAAHDEIDKIVGIVPPLKESLKPEKYEKELFDTIGELDLSTAEIKEFSKKTQETIKALKEKFAASDDEDEDEDEEDEEDEEEQEVEVEEEEEEDEDDEEDVIPAPVVKKGKAPVVVEEDEEEDDEDDDEELSLVDQVLACKKKSEYIELINANVEFKKDKKRLLAITSVFSLKKEMLAIVAPAKQEKATPAPVAKSKKAPVVEDDDDDEEEAEEVNPAKKAAKVPVEKVVKEKAERPASIEWPKGFAVGDTVSFQNKAKEKVTGKLKKYMWHKQSAKFWYIIDVAGKDCYKHAEEVTKVKAK